MPHVNVAAARPRLVGPAVDLYQTDKNTEFLASGRGSRQVVSRMDPASPFTRLKSLFYF
jgi:hypothetical protein